MNPQEQPQQPKPLRNLVITQWDNGTVTVTGPIADKLACYGLIEVARDIIAKQDHAKAKEQAPMILPVRQNGFPLKQ